jgi:lipoate-protein ligase A
LIVKHLDKERKISGSAYKLRLGNHKTGEGKRSLHHGTMLLDLELDALTKYLNPNKAKLLSKGVDSVIQRVINLKELN